MSRNVGKIVVLFAVATHLKLPIRARYGLMSRRSTHLGGWIVPWRLRPEYEQQFRESLSRKRKGKAKKEGWQLYFMVVHIYLRKLIFQFLIH